MTAARNEMLLGSGLFQQAGRGEPQDRTGASERGVCPEVSEFVKLTEDWQRVPSQWKR